MSLEDIRFDVTKFIPNSGRPNRKLELEYLIFMLESYNQNEAWVNAAKPKDLSGEIIPKEIAAEAKNYYTIEVSHPLGWKRRVFDVVKIQRDFVDIPGDDRANLPVLEKKLKKYRELNFLDNEGKEIEPLIKLSSATYFPDVEIWNPFSFIHTLEEEGVSYQVVEAMQVWGISPENYRERIIELQGENEDISDIFRILDAAVIVRGGSKEKEQEPRGPPPAPPSSGRANSEEDVKPSRTSEASRSSGSPGDDGNGDDGNGDDDEDDDENKREKKSPPIKKMASRRVPRRSDAEGGSLASIKTRVNQTVGRNAVDGSVSASTLQQGTEYLIDLVQLKLIKSGSFNPIRLYVDYEKVKKDEFADVFHHFLRVTEKGGFDFIEYGAADSEHTNDTPKAMGEIEILKRLLNITEKKIDSVEKLIRDTEEELTKEINRGRDPGRVAKLSKTLRKIKKERASLDQIIKKATTEAENPFKDVATDCGVYSMPLAPPDIKRILEKNSIYSVQTMDLITTSMNETFSKIVNKAINYTNGEGTPALANAEDSAVYNCVIGRTRPRQATKEREIIPEGLIKTRYAYAPPGAAEVLGVTNPQGALLAAETRKYGLMNPGKITVPLIPSGRQDEGDAPRLSGGASSSGDAGKLAALEKENADLKASIEAAKAAALLKKEGEQTF